MKKLKIEKEKVPKLRSPSIFRAQGDIIVARYSDGTLHRIMPNGQHIKIN